MPDGGTAEDHYAARVAADYATLISIAAGTSSRSDKP